MASVNAVRFLAKDGDDRAIAMELARGIAYNQFYERRDFFDEGNHNRLYAYWNLDYGKAYQFERHSDLNGALEHIAGQVMSGQNYAVDKDTITVDQPIVSHYYVPFEQQQMAHFDQFTQLAAHSGRKVRELIDSRIAVTGIKAARTAALTKDGLSIHPGGNIVERTAASQALAYPATVTGARQFRDDVAQLKQLMDEDNVPMEGRYLYINAYTARVLAQDTTMANRDLTSVPWDVNTRAYGMLEGFALIQTNRLPDSQNITLSSSDGISQGNSKYVLDNRVDGDVGQCVALAFCSDGMNAPVAIVEQGGFVFDTERMIDRNAEFLKSQITVGMGVLNPQCAGEIRVAAS